MEWYSEIIKEEVIFYPDLKNTASVFTSSSTRFSQEVCHFILDVMNICVHRNLLVINIETVGRMVTLSVMVHASNLAPLPSVVSYIMTYIIFEF